MFQFLSLLVYNYLLIPILQRIIRFYTSVRAQRVTKSLRRSALTKRHDPTKCLDGMRKLSQALASFKIDEVSGKTLFAEHWKPAITERASLVDNPNPAAAYQIALKEMWDVVDQAEWEVKAQRSVNIYE